MLWAFLCLLVLILIGEISQTAMVPFGFWKKPATAAPSNSWTAITTTNAPSAREFHSMVWTGSLVIVWGGENASDVEVNTGGRYDPATNTWTATSVGSNVPDARQQHTAIWADGGVNRMIIWGGYSDANYYSSGAQYDPVADAWSSTPSLSITLPYSTTDSTTVWTGTKLLRWGGAYGGNGYAFDPSTNTWSTTSGLNAPENRYEHTAVWTGSKMIVWGGFGQNGTYDYVNTGGIYDPSSDTWTATSTTGAPVARWGHSAIWASGSINKMIIWGGVNISGAELNTGGLYDPATDLWTSTSTTSPPSARHAHSAVWTGSLMIIWGGTTTSDLNTGSRYDPSGNSWAATSTTSAPSARAFHSAVWTGSKMFIWGGGYSTMPSGTGGLYDPSGDSWTALPTTGAPAARSFHSTAWTGSKVIIWGGYNTSYNNVNTGGVYDVAGNSWSTMTTTNAPAARRGNSAVWTGTEMVVWGGVDNLGKFIPDGGRYNPTTNTWSILTFVPGGRYSHTAIWTGSKMIIWGGYGGGGTLNTGAEYDPIADTWTPISTTAAPTARYMHTAVWTGSKMIVHAGHDGSYTNTGGQYDPASDTWTATSTTGPAVRAGHFAFWTGTAMLVFAGGNGGTNDVMTGSLYDPGANTWTSISTTGVPSARWSGTANAVWTGAVMIYWGGYASSTYLNTGSRYDPVANTWAATTTTSAPAGRWRPGMVWAGNKMIVWGGYAGVKVNTGGAYTP